MVPTRTDIRSLTTLTYGHDAMPLCAMGMMRADACALVCEHACHVRLNRASRSPARTHFSKKLRSEMWHRDWPHLLPKRYATSPTIPCPVNAYHAIGNGARGVADRPPGRCQTACEYVVLLKVVVLLMVVLLDSMEGMDSRTWLHSTGQHISGVSRAPRRDRKAARRDEGATQHLGSGSERTTYLRH